jgi:hypothetical protein
MNPHPLTYLTVLSFIGAALITFGAVLAAKEHAWLKKAQIGPGTVVELVPKRGAKGRRIFTPRVRFTAQDGSIHDFVSASGSRPAGFNVGEDVHVAYDPRTFEGRILTFGQRFGFAAAIIIIGLSMVLMRITFSVGNRLVPRIYVSQTSDGPMTRSR